MKIKADNSHWKFWRAPHLDDLELLCGSNITHEYPPHVHEEYCVLLMLKGVEVTVCRGVTHSALPGSLGLMNPDEVHSSRSVGAEYRIIRIRPNSFRRIVSESAGRDLGTLHFTKLVVDDAPIFRSLLNLHLKLEQNISSLEQESEFVSTMGAFVSRHLGNYPAPRPAGREPRHVKTIRDYLKSHYAENVSLSQLTSITNLSPFYLLRVFHNQVGFPPHEYQTQVRIAHARKLLLEGQPISHVALETGFCDQSHLSRNFKRIVGMTPGQFSSQSKIVQDPTRRV
ncbi:MAG TPA: AraC family transcriptional regulator [Pyrinomonadaceae bacterium]|nr:AraC family transcriptional regulator [Pyrinomonadaceae bacterium]